MSLNIFCICRFINLKCYYLSSEAKLRQTNLGMEAENKAMEKKNRKLEDKFVDLKEKLEEIERASTAIITVNAEKEELQKALDQMKRKHEIQEQRIGEIVKSLELIENQNALNSHNLSSVMKENLELKSALEVSKSQIDHVKKSEEEMKVQCDEVKKENTMIKDNICKI